MKSKKLTKYSALGLSLIVLSAIITSGAVFTYLFSGTITANADVLMEYDQGSGWENAEDLTVDITTSTIVAGETETWKHDIQCSSNLNTGLYAHVTFSYDGSTNGDMEGTNLYVYVDDGTTNTPVLEIIDGVDQALTNEYTFEGGDTADVFIKIVADDNLMEGAYDWDYSTTVNVDNIAP